MKKTLALVGLTGGLVLGSFGQVEAQWERGDVGWCERQWGGSDSERYCMALSADFADPGRLVVDGGMNGGVEVRGSSGDRVEVTAKVWARAGSDSRAEALASGVQVSMDGERLSARGPDVSRNESWGVSWEITVPFDTDLEIDTHNGGVSVVDVRGRIRFEALNGGVSLDQVSGDVVGRTTNGGVNVVLDGASWRGEGLDVETTNGGITIEVPSSYSARLEARTVNGRIAVDFPVTVQGRIGRTLSTTIGEGGPLLRAVTTNGGVRIARGETAIR